MILISAGHHPFRKGASAGNIYEYDVAIEWAAIIVGMIDTGVTLVPPGLLRNKVAFINKQPGVSLAVEVHFNSAPDHDGDGDRGNGCETLYCPGSVKGKVAAEIIQRSMAEILPPDRGVKEGWYRMQKGGSPDYFLRFTNCPAVIIEPAFIEDVASISDPLSVCASIAQSIVKANEVM